KRTYHHTAPVNTLYALHESLRLLATEGLEQAWARHQAMHQQLKQGLHQLGIDFVVAEPYRLPQLNAIYIPVGVEDAAVRSRLLNDYNLEIGAGLGDLAGKAWRIGLMGFGARRENVALCLQALGEVLR
ncbi:MAG: alanine--glyoxylate aminotransferase, partial [Alishewanella sp. 32-51-5]